MRPVLKFVLALSASSVIAGTAFAESFTTRIEPRAYYGATVTIEEGVRVFRPLPPVRHVIINPNGATPLSLSYNDTRVYEERHNYNYNKFEGVSGRSYGGSGLGHYGFGGSGYGGKPKGHGGASFLGGKKHH